MQKKRKKCHFCKFFMLFRPTNLEWSDNFVKMLDALIKLRKEKIFPQKNAEKTQKIAFLCI